MTQPTPLSHISSLILYEGGKPTEVLERELGITSSIKLASNENPLGAPPQVKEYLQSAGNSLALYPDGGGFYLKSALAKRLNVKPENIILGNGSNEIINLVAQGYLDVGDEAIFSERAFIAYRIAVEMVRGACLSVPAKEEFHHDLDAFSQAITEKTKIIYIANPNNPTGTLLPKEELLSFIDAVPRHILIVIDEAYYEYNDPELFLNTAHLACERSNILLLRTFSKIYGLAALRIGYGIAHPDIIQTLNRLRAPFNVNALALKCAEIALTDEEHIQKGRENNDKGKKQLEEGFKSLSFEYVPTYGNFFLLHVGNGVEVTKALEQKGVIVRPMAGYGLTEYIRVSIGTPDENSVFLKTLSV